MKKLIFLLMPLTAVFGQKNITTASDATAPLHALQPDYPTSYGVPTAGQVQETLDRLFIYLEKATPSSFIDKSTNMPAGEYSDKTAFAKGDFRPISYEWGVTYSGMLALHALTKQEKYRDYVFRRLDAIHEFLPKARVFEAQNPQSSHVLKGLITPKALDDIGAMAMAVIKAKSSGYNKDVSFITQRASDFILKEEHRLPDRTLVRIRPLKNTLWLDDLYMAIPALLQLGRSTGNQAYFDEAVFQFSSYRKRMFNAQLGIFMHGYLEGAEAHPEFHWARANGWALLTTAEMLEYLPANHPGRGEVLAQLKN
jgi:rhamnogalacturonyl hydrolase YesR